jgi:hypothetical protein
MLYIGITLGIIILVGGGIYLAYKKRWIKIGTQPEEGGFEGSTDSIERGSFGSSTDRANRNALGKPGEKNLYDRHDRDVKSFIDKKMEKNKSVFDTFKSGEGEKGDSETLDIEKSKEKQEFESSLKKEDAKKKGGQTDIQDEFYSLETGEKENISSSDEAEQFETFHKGKTKNSESKD